MENLKAIRSFSGENRWLSNFWLAPVELVAFGQSYTFASTEHLFQMAKIEHTDLSLDAQRELFDEVASLESPGRAKRFGRSIPSLNENSWNSAKDEAMSRVLRAKYSQNENLRLQLLALDGYFIEEGNHWGDRYWGVDGTGLNKLGLIYMDLRDHWLEESRNDPEWTPARYVPVYFSDPDYGATLDLDTHSKQPYLTLITHEKESLK